MSHTHYLGIDNGLTGAMAAIMPGGSVFVYRQPVIPGKRKVPDEITMRTWALRYKRVAFCVIERIQSIPGNAARAMASYGTLHGIWRGMLVAFDIPYQIVTPSVWQRLMLAGTPTNLDTKQRSIIAAKRLFPGVSLRPTDKCRKDSDGMSDALLMAEYARRIHKVDTA